MKRTERIADMERYLDETRAAVDRMAEALDAYEAVQKGYRKLCGYYGSAQWMGDFAADEAGRLPADLKRGVLSEDGLYDLIMDNHELIVRMMKLMTEMAQYGQF
ncbi:MAG: DUF4298 domain-containing protein [Solobacterium sp.]|nr:DUF4298 domain-containing protein [Solobacterium sp.]